MTQAAVTVFIDTDHMGDAIDASLLFRLGMIQVLGRELELDVKVNEDGDSVKIKIEQMVETGSAMCNGYFRVEPTSRAFPRKVTNDEDGFYDDTEEG